MSVKMAPGPDDKPAVFVSVVGRRAVDASSACPQQVLEDVGSVYSRVAPNNPYVVRDGKLLTGQNQQSASEYGVVLLHALMGHSPVSQS